MALVAALALCLAAPDAVAHESEVSVELIVQPRTDATLVLVLCEVTGGEGAESLRSDADIDRNGTLDETERAALAETLALRAVAGVSVERDGVALDVTSVEQRLELQPSRDGAVVLAMMLEMPGGDGRYSVSVDDASARITVEFEAGPELELTASLAAMHADQLGAGPWVVAPGDRVWVDVGAAADGESP